MTANTSQQRIGQVPPAQSATKPTAAAMPPGVPPPMQTIILHAPQDPVPINIKTSPTDYNGIGLSIGASVVVAVVTSYIGFRVAKLQLERQRKDTQEQQRANTKAQLRLDAYKDIQASLAKCAAIRSPASKLATIRADLNRVVGATRDNKQPALRSRTSTFTDNLDAFQNALRELRLCVERYEAILPGFDIFKAALSCALHELVRLRGPVEQVLEEWMPMQGKDHGETILFNVKFVTAHAQTAFDKASWPLETAIRQAEGWVFDLGVEAQNFALAQYADQVVSRRKPDAPFFTLTVDPADRQEIKKKLDGTEYGRAVIASLTYHHRKYFSHEEWMKTQQE